MDYIVNNLYNDLYNILYGNREIISDYESQSESSRESYSEISSSDSDECIIQKKHEELKKIKVDVNYKCCICLGDMSGDEDLAKLNCNHVFHFNCINRYLREYNHLCPVCKGDSSEYYGTIEYESD